MADEEFNIEQIIAAQAWACASRYRGIADAEDLIQQGWVWVLEHDEKVEGYRTAENLKFSAYALGQDIWKVMDRYARKEKASRGGYEAEDELFYSDAVINVVLPAVLKGDPTPPERDGERVANTSDPAEGGVWMATYMDVLQAWEKADLTGQQRELLVSYYLNGDTQLEISEALEINQKTVSRRLKQARGALIDALGGPSPADYTPRIHERPGTKHNNSEVYAALR